MLFKNILGHSHIKNHLCTTAEQGRIPHAQLFVGPEGCGALAMAIAYSQYVLCGNHSGENQGGDANCNLKCNGLTHPDLQFVFPVANSDTVKSHAISDHYLPAWRTFVKEQPYGNLFDWYRSIGIEKKQGQIGVDEANEIVRKMALKPYEGGYKVLIVWMAERMNTPAANKLLKILEEPPKNTVIILIAEDEEQIINTIHSRCQVLHFPPLAEEIVANGLVERGLIREEALKIAHEAQGNFNKALDLMNKDSEDLIFEQWFVLWTRTAFKAKGNKAAINELILWSDEIARTGRETQKKFLGYCLAVFRQAMLINYGAGSLAYMKMHVEGFKLEKFAPFVHENNILGIVEELENAIYHVQRNGNARIIFTDLSIRLTRLLHKKAA